tara:strand:+ start:473 stop:1627 length:1155 start_codon:yes stop_codon:yes gene_type:complete
MKHFGFRRNYQVAKYFNVTPQTLSGWIKSGEIPSKHIMKYSLEINNENINKGQTELLQKKEDISREINEEEIVYKWNSFFKLLKQNLAIIFLLPLLTTFLTTIFVFYISKPVYTSKSKVLPISENGNTSNSFSGFASQLGINIPLNIGGKVPWDEIYPEILKSGALLESMLEKSFLTLKYKDETLENILIYEHRLSKFEKQDRKNRVVDKLKQMIKISKDRSSSIINIDVDAFEPKFASELARELIQNSSSKQRELKTKRIRQKRQFIEERLNQVSTEMKEMEKELRLFRENNRNLSTSPSLQMKVQEMGREVDLQNSLYVTLKTQYEKAKIDEIGRDDMIQQIDGPSFPTKLTSPRRALSILMSFIIGAMISIFIIHFKEKYI